MKKPRSKGRRISRMAKSTADQRGYAPAPSLVSDGGSSAELVKWGGDPAVPSLAYTAALPDWVMVRTILSGARAVRGAGVCYLPKYNGEDDDAYAVRVANAPFINHFRDHMEGIVSKPFSKEVLLQGEVTQNIEDICENIDGQGTSLHKFARDIFKEAVSFGVVGLLVDFPSVPEGSTLEQERNLGARPYWVSYRAEDIIALYTEFRGGRRYVSHVRLREDVVKRVGFSERRFRRVRVLDDDPETGRIWQLWEEGGVGWNLIDQGTITLSEIPFRIYKPGEREWWTNSTVSPLIDLAYAQIEHYQQNSNLKHVLELAGFPMLAGNGIPAPLDQNGNVKPINIGPGIVCYAPPQAGLTHTTAKWEFIEPQGTSIERLQEQIQAIELQMSTLGKAPLVRNKGSVTATAEAVNAAKGHAAAEAWAMDLKDVLEVCLAFTAAWLNEDVEAEVYVHTDFGVDLRENKENWELIKAVEGRVLSRRTLWDEWLRRGFLGPQFDASEENKRLSTELAQDKKDGLFEMPKPDSSQDQNDAGASADFVQDDSQAGNDAAAA